MAHTFRVSDVALGRCVELESLTVSEAIARTLSAPRYETTTDEKGQNLTRPVWDPVDVEAAGKLTHGVSTLGGHPLIETLSLAFNAHFPLVLSPDHVWITLAQGVAEHIRLHGEELRHHFVAHEGRTTLEVVRNSFTKGSQENDWPGVFDEFSDQLARQIGPKRDLFVADFSTTGPLERAASQLVLMDAMEKYFEYEMHTLCGIPEITLLGTGDDWRSMRERARAFSEFGLKDWCEALDPILEQFMLASEGRVDRQFWKSIYKFNSESGSETISGWIQTFFPYLMERPEKTIVKNHGALDWRNSAMKSRRFPCALNTVPFNWKYLGEIIPMEFIGGFVGLSQEPNSLAVTPQLSWAVREISKAGAH